MIRSAFIGIDRYHDPMIRDLSGAVRDATALWAVFSDAMEEFRGTPVTNAAATLIGIRRTLDETLGAADEKDTVLLGFAGHGTPDYRLAVADTQSSDVFRTTLGLDELAERFQKTRARAVILLLDCCFQGGPFARVLDTGAEPRGLGISPSEVAGRDRLVLTACAPREGAFENPQTRHGLFTEALVACLLDSSEPIGIARLAERVVRAVRTGATRLGFAQTPAMFGRIENEPVLAPARRGQHYREVFPDRAPLETRGDFSDLAGHGIPPDILRAWRNRYPAGMNALQVAAVNDHGILCGHSLFVVAPTSAGKTFVGEMAAIGAVAEGRKAVFLLPYRALVNEKYDDFATLYGEQLGLRVVRCSGEWQDQVDAVIRGKYDIAFFTYEKFLALILSTPHLLHQIGLVVLDEAQFITEPGRGSTVELLLTRLASAKSRGVTPQLVALSAVIGATNGFEEWLGCRLLRTAQRPVPLVEGVFDRTGVWQFLTSEGTVHSVQLIDRSDIRQRSQKPSLLDLIVPLVRQLVAAGETLLIFRNSRGATTDCAEYLASTLELPPAQKVLDAFPEGDPSETSARLQRTLLGGVAFHHGNLNREERIAIERGFRDADGGIRVLVATSTVAAGINTPASTVIIAETNFPGGKGREPYTVAQFKNMAGRAGRLGYETQGKAIVLAKTAPLRESLFQLYVQGQPETISSSFDPDHLGTWIIRLLAQVEDVDRDAVIDLLANTYGGYLVNGKDGAWREKMAPKLWELLRRMLRDGLIRQVEGRLHLTTLGRACGESPLTLESTLQLIELLHRLEPDNATLETLLVLVEALPERDQDYTPQDRAGEQQWHGEAARRFGRKTTQLLQYRAETNQGYFARCKRALIVHDWIDGRATGEIEAFYSWSDFARVAHGDIRGYADGSRFLLESVLRIAEIVLRKAMDREETLVLFKRLDIGIPPQIVDLTDLPYSLTRGELLGLWHSGLSDRSAVAAATLPELQRAMGRRANELYARLHPAGHREAAAVYRKTDLAGAEEFALRRISSPL